MRLRVNIDRLVLYDMDMSETGAGRMKDILEVELGRLLTQSEWLDRIADRRKEYIAAEPMKAPLGNNENHLARGLASQIAKTITGVTE